MSKMNSPIKWKKVRENERINVDEVKILNSLPEASRIMGTE